jgi:hypothetical protein
MTERTVERQLLRAGPSVRRAYGETDLPLAA